MTHESEILADVKTSGVKRRAAHPVHRKPGETPTPNIKVNAAAPAASAGNPAMSAQFNVELIQLATSNLPEEELRKQIRMIAIRFTGATGAGHAMRDDDGDWDLKAANCSGRLPRRSDFSSELGTRCQQVATSATTQVDPLPHVDGQYAMLSPVGRQRSASEVFLLVIGDNVDARWPMLVIEKLTAMLHVCQKNIESGKQDWKLNSLSVMIELVSRIEECQTVVQAGTLVANEMARYLSASHAAVATMDSGKLENVTVSGSEKIDARSAGFHAYRQCLSEVVLRDEPAIWPPAEPGDDRLLLAHRQLAAELQTPSIVSFPLKSVSGKVVGGWLFAGEVSVLQTPRLFRFINAVSPRVANAIDVVARTEQPAIVRAITNLPEMWQEKKARVASIVGLLLLAMMFLPLPYRVRCHCSVQPGVRRFAVAPFDGSVLQGFVEPGDEVKQGQVLAEMDGRELRYELAGVVAERDRAMKQRAIDLADHAIADVLLSDLEADRLRAQQDLLDFKQDHLQIRSPIDGVVLAGSLEQAQAAGVRTGDVMFEIGSRDQIMIQVEVPADEVTHIQTGSHVSVWVEGQQGSTVWGKINRIRPQSELRNARNVFIADVEVEANARLRPGMQGSARINGKVRCLGWNLFHKPLEYLISIVSF